MATLASRASLAGCLREKGRWSLFVWLMLLAVVVPIDAVAAQQPERPEVAERQVKAAYLYKFASYVRWPADSFAHERSPIVIGVIVGLSEKDHHLNLIVCWFVSQVLLVTRTDYQENRT